MIELLIRTGPTAAWFTEELLEVKGALYANVFHIDLFGFWASPVSLYFTTGSNFVQIRFSVFDLPTNKGRFFKLEPCLLSQGLQAALCLESFFTFYT